MFDTVTHDATSCQNCKKACPNRFLNVLPRLDDNEDLPKGTHTMAQWLDLHAFGEHAQARVAQMLTFEAAKTRPIPDTCDKAHSGLDFQAALRLVVAALAARFPCKSEKINRVADRVRFEIAQGQAFTALSQNKTVLVRLSFDGSAADLLTLAHEFGHALQLSMTSGEFVPPVRRELAAFSAEQILVDYLKLYNPVLAARVLRAHEEADARCFGEDAEALAEAMSDPAAVYSYRWNYPVARLAAARACGWLPDRMVWKVFGGTLDPVWLLGSAQVLDNRDLAPVSRGLARRRNIGCFFLARQSYRNSATDLSMQEFLAAARAENDRAHISEMEHPPMGAGWADRFAAIGLALTVMAQSQYHRSFRPVRYFAGQVLPPLNLGQMRYYVGPSGVPTGYLTWAYLSDDVLAEVLLTGRKLEQNEWRCGPNPLVYDWISDRHTTGAMVRDMTTNLFPDHVIHGIRRNPDGSMRRVARMRGVNVTR